jgi:geranylgeranyl diphosphate/geranylgeranyl-bacteriochlorophyllide a reductase
MSVGVGSAAKGFSLRDSTAALRKQAGLEECETIRKEGAPLPLYPAKKWDNGRDVVLAGDAAGVVAPASGEGIYYAMATGRLAAEAADECLSTGDARALAKARKRFMKEHGRVFFILWIMQTFWYRSDKRREKFVALCKDQGHPAPHLGILHEQEARAPRSDGACARLLQGSGANPRPRAHLTRAHRGPRHKLKAS